MIVLLLAAALAAPTTANPDPKAVKCKAVKEIGSKIPQRECKTLAQWKEEARLTRDEMERSKRQNPARDRNQD